MPITTCDSPETLRSEIDLARKKVTLDETEETWDTIAQGILHLTRLCSIGGCQFSSEMVAGIRSISRPLNSVLNSERSKLSGAAVELVTALATGLGSSFEPLVSQFVPTLLVLCGRTNKVFTSRARACILAIIQHTQLPSLLPYLADLANHKSVFPRLAAAEGILACLNCFNPPDLEKETRARIVEDFIKSTARDANADVRKASKEVFKAYKTLMPARVTSFVAPLTPVVKKYLDIQTGPSGTHNATSNAGQRQISRPPSRANNMVTERPASSALPKPPPRPATNCLAHSTKQRPPGRGFPTAADARGPRQRTLSQMQRDPPPRTLHINAQSSSTAQRCVVPTSAPARQTVHPVPGIARVPPAPGVSSKGPQRPPPAQMKLNPSSDRLKATGNGAKRIPFPSVPVNGQPSGQAAATATANRTGSTTDEHEPLSKLPSRNTKAVVPGKLLVARKAPEVPRLASASVNPASGSLAQTAPAVVQRSNKPPVKDKVNPSRTAPHRRPASNVKKATRPLVKAERKETSPTLVPLPPSRPTSPREMPLPGSPDCTPRPVEAREEIVVAPLSGSPSSNPAEKQPRSAEPCQEQVDIPPSTPITALLASIQRGFLFTPSSPLSPPQNYLPAPGNLLERRQDTMKVGHLTKGPLAGTAFCAPLEDNATSDGLDRHALQNLN